MKDKIMQKKEHINAIDGLKGLACCEIAFLWHYLNMQSRSSGMPLESILCLWKVFCRIVFSYFWVCNVVLLQRKN